jgi:hypothetical protein
MPRAVRLCSIVVILALFGSVGAMAAPLPKKAFVARGNGYCSAYYVKLNRLTLPQTVPEVAQWLRAERPYLVTLARQLGSLVPPVAARARYAAMLAELRTEFPVADRLIAAADRGDGARVQSLSARLVAMDERYDNLANSVGLRICGKPSPR